MILHKTQHGKNPTRTQLTEISLSIEVTGWTEIGKYHCIRFSSVKPKRVHNDQSIVVNRVPTAANAPSQIPANGYNIACIHLYHYINMKWRPAINNISGWNIVKRKHVCRSKRSIYLVHQTPVYPYL